MHQLLTSPTCARGAAAVQFIQQYRLPVTVINITIPAFVARSPNWERQLREQVQDFYNDDALPAMLPVLMNDGRLILSGFTLATWSTYWHITKPAKDVL
jgi:hypothetical protein